jgi:hypothetical protein
MCISLSLVTRTLFNQNTDPVCGHPSLLAVTVYVLKPSGGHARKNSESGMLIDVK